MKKLAVSLALATSLALPAVAAPTPPPVPTPVAAPAKGERREEMREKVQAKIQAFLTGELTSRLSLDATKSAKLADAVKAHMGRKHEREKTLHEAMQKLNQLVDSKAPDAQVKAQLDVVLGASSRDDDVQAFVADTAKFLSVTEQAKLAIAMPDILKDVHRMMRDARREMRGKAGGGFGGKQRAGDED